MRKKFHVRTQARKRPCNLCGKAYRAPSVFSRFCVDCKSEQEILKFAEWLPDLDDGNSRYVPVRPRANLAAKLRRQVAA